MQKIQISYVLKLNLSDFYLFLRLFITNPIFRPFIIHSIIPSLSIFLELREKTTINKRLNEINIAIKRVLIPISERVRPKRYCIIREKIFVIEF